MRILRAEYQWVNMAPWQARALAGGLEALATAIEAEDDS